MVPVAGLQWSLRLYVLVTAVWNMVPVLGVKKPLGTCPVYLNCCAGVTARESVFIA